MGSVAKPLIRLQGVPLISRKLVALSGAGVDEVVVTGYAFCLTGSPDQQRRQGHRRRYRCRRYTSCDLSPNHPSCHRYHQ